jgi:uncharacterized protein
MKTVFFWVAGAYLFILASLFLVQRVLLFHPQPDGGSPAAQGFAEFEVIEVTTADGLELVSWYLPPQVGKPVLVHFPGNASGLANRAYGAQMLASQGYGQLIVGYRGYHGNPGTPTEVGLYADARANLNWLGDKPYIFMGESLGTGVAVQMALEYAPKGIILESPYASIPATAQNRYWWLPVYWLVRDKFDNLAKIGQIKAPLFIVQGSDDKIVPAKFGRQVFATAPEPKEALWLEGAGHNPWSSPKTLPAIEHWLARLNK